ncbi:HK97 family phage prohead protease [Mycobacterium colombiense]|uniref:Prohead serine protease domain-containing protein n=1 Tax=Mycobacterium colombiense TaxID=339268 RepID=A0A1A2Z1D8_9MYCO|nr:HK97 family phage prohead protease [Mycobacterium colombiense]OBI42986.1 hypothetical protein A5708_19290 [Mycobacterium colombiense]
MSNSERSAPPVERLHISDFQGFRAGSPIEVRSSQSRTIGGYAAVFDRSSENLGGFYERIHPKAFNKSKSDQFPGVVCRFNHSDDYLLGTTRSGTLRLTVDNTGLDYSVDLPECRNDILEMTARGDLAHSSFAFQVWTDDWTKFDNGYPVRQLLSCRIIDVAPVVNPAYSETSVALRSFARFVDAPFEDVVERAQKDELRSFWQRTDNIDPQVGKSSPPTPQPGAEPEGRDPHKALAELAEIRYGPKLPNLNQDIINIQQRMGARTAASIDANEAQLRDRELVHIATTAQREAREADWFRVLEEHRRRAQITDLRYPEA